MKVIGPIFVFFLTVLTILFVYHLFSPLIFETFETVVEKTVIVEKEVDVEKVVGVEKKS